MSSEGTFSLVDYPINNAYSYCCVAVKTVLAAVLKKDYLLSVAIILIAISLSPFALAESGILPARIFYITLMPVLLFSLLCKGKIQVNSFIVSIIAIQVIVIGFVILAEGADVVYFLKMTGTLLGVGFISVMFSSDFIDIHVFVKVAVLFTLAVLLASVISAVFAYLGYFEPVPLFDRGGGEYVYKVGYSLTNEVAQVGSGYFIRPSGVFTEPGMLAMYVSLAIIANAVVLGSRKYELLLIFFGLFTSTLSFYLFVIAFLMLFKRWKLLALCATIFLVLILFVFVMPDIENNIIWYKSIGRINLFFGQNFGDNRYGATMEGLLNLDRLNILGCVDREILSNYENVGVEATILGPFLAYGLVGGMFAYLHIFLFAAVPFWAWIRLPHSKVPINMLAIFVLLVLNLFHRPFTFHFLYYVYVIVIFEWQWRKYFTRPGMLKSI